ncbi:MAG: PAS domain S-box protein [Planctomycetes bacterium]|nr:PAS domain S-box protein [Planctomycetota bacterium]
MSCEPPHSSAAPAVHGASIVPLAESLSFFIALLQGDEITYVNPAGCALLGRPNGYFVGRRLRELVYDETRETGIARAQPRMVVCGQCLRATERFLHADGRAIWIDCSVDVIELEGRPTNLVTGYDITAKKKAEEELQRSEERFRNLCRQAPVMLMSFDPDGRIRDVSDFWLQTMGYERREVIGTDGWCFIESDSAERLRQAIAQNQLRNEMVIKNFPLRALRRDGSPIDLLATSVAELDDQGASRGAICVQINLTDLQRAEAALRESEERYRALVEHAPEAIMVVDVDLGRFVDANAHAEKLFGLPRERLLTMGPLDFCSESQASGRDSSDLLGEEQRKVLEGETPVFDFTLVDAHGREVHCETRLSRLPAAGRRLIRMTTTDISELKMLQEKVRRADKLAAVGALAAGVAHEIGNPLMALSMAAQSLERRTEEEYTQKKLALIREHSERISRIVRQMSELARPQSARREACDLNRIVRRAVDMVRYDERAKSAAIHYELDPELPCVIAVEDELTQVCINLALNAFDAMASNPPSKERRLTIRSASTPQRVTLSFRDNGHGISAAVRKKLFEPFFTTKEAGRGSGLGLSVSYRILEEHAGALRLDESVTDGAAFVLELPRSAAS